MRVQVLLFLLLVPNAGAVYEGWQYVRDVQAGNGVHKLVLDQHAIQHMNADGSDLRLYARTELSYQFMKDNAQAAPSAITASSTRPGYSDINYQAGNAIDGDTRTYWESNVLEEKTGSYLTVLFQMPIVADQATIKGSLWTAIGVDALVDGKWSVIKQPEKIAYSTTVSFPGIRAEGFRFVFEHTGSVQVQELELKGSAWVLVFDAVPDTKLYYGNSQAKAPSYAARFSVTAQTPSALLGQARRNPDFSADLDNDGIVSDNCPLVPNPHQEDSDKDSVGDLCDNCRNARNADQLDSDSDTFGDACDNCPRLQNQDQYDDNLNGIGYICDDADNDGVINSRDNCVNGPNQYQQDIDKDGIGDACEDDDYDGVKNYADNCVKISNPGQDDSDRNNVGNPCDDPDKDGVIAVEDNCPNMYNPKKSDGSQYIQPDADYDGLGDACDPKDDRYSEQPRAVFGLLIAVVAIAALLAFIVFRRKR